MSPYLLSFAIGEFDSATLWHNAIQYKIYLARNTTENHRKNLSGVGEGNFIEHTRNKNSNKIIQKSGNLNSREKDTQPAQPRSDVASGVGSGEIVSAQYSNPTFPLESNTQISGAFTKGNETNMAPNSNGGYSSNVISAASTNLNELNNISAVSTNTSEGMDYSETTSFPHKGFTSYLNACVKLVAYFERQLGVDYKLPKLDLLFLPGFRYEALENWGLISIK